MASKDDKDNGRIREEYRRRKSIRITLFVVALVFLTVVGIVVLPVMDSLGVHRLMWAPFVYLVMFFIILAIAFVWRCPVCNAILGDIFTTRFCSKCGLQFYD